MTEQNDTWVKTHIEPVVGEPLCPTCDVDRKDAVQLVCVAPGLDRCPKCGQTWTAKDLLEHHNADQWWWEIEFDQEIVSELLENDS